jgi:hypothetical protein
VNIMGRRDTAERQAVSRSDRRILARFDYETRPAIDLLPADLAQARADFDRASPCTMGAVWPAIR